MTRILVWAGILAAGYIVSFLVFRWQYHLSAIHSVTGKTEVAVIYPSKSYVAVFYPLCVLDELLSGTRHTYEL